MPKSNAAARAEAAAAARAQFLSMPSQAKAAVAGPPPAAAGAAPAPAHPPRKVSIPKLNISAQPLPAAESQAAARAEDFAGDDLFDA